ncbi:RNA polymerase sigma-70 factor [Chitinophaga oryzae]|uniref:RNA polymerase sigma-70 factor n=1 Tax=Chitinophaga oryzae TaxID=2725414 RepID=A0AAE6ZHA8_9BACT|nr:RNA polymerase sigma-70 factor [Chitinophaga oryzae]QJB33113.1 RNA polymerase sigma-70 factor [Chitinophaga oryzae]
MEPYTDAQLVADLKIGSEWAFTQLYNRYYKRLHIEANYVLKDAEEAADVVHDVLIIIWNRRDKLADNLHLKSYLTTCVRNKCMDRIRRSVVKERNVHQYMSLKELTTCINPMERKELSLQLATAINALPVAQRTVFELSYMEDKTQREIVAEKNRSLQTVKNQMSTTLRILRKKLKSSRDL